ncbi:hypothetical protein GIX45_23465 [Erwinia sp. CPCC 100877]|nr:hypothetical protein [Erwinia sp. CPCC 100877]
MDKRKKLYLLILLITLCLVVYLPVAKAKFIKKSHYTFAITTKALTPVSTAFNFTGDFQEFRTSKEGYYIFQLWGANGGDSSNGYVGGTGDSFTCIGYFSKDQVFQIAIGGVGNNGSGSTGGASGYNGGGTGGNSGWFGFNSGGGGGGGGAGGNSVDTKGGSVSAESFTETNQDQYKGYFRSGLAGIGDESIAGGNFSGGGGSLVGGEAFYLEASDLSQGNNGTEGVGGNAGNWAGGGGSSTNSISGGGGAGSSYYNEALTNLLSNAVIDQLPTNQDFPEQPYQAGSGFAIITYVGKILPN